jgi:hypothetical protein
VTRLRCDDLPRVQLDAQSWTASPAAQLAFANRPKSCYQLYSLSPDSLCQLRPPLCLELTSSILRIAPELMPMCCQLMNSVTIPPASHYGCSVTVDIEGTAISNDLGTRREIRNGRLERLNTRSFRCRLGMTEQWLLTYLFLFSGLTPTYLEGFLSVILSRKRLCILSEVRLRTSATSQPFGSDLEFQPCQLMAVQSDGSI